MRRWAGDINARGSVHTEVRGEVRGEGGGRSVRLCAHKSLHVYIYTETKRPEFLSPNINSTSNTVQSTQ